MRLIGLWYVCGLSAIVFAAGLPLTWGPLAAFGAMFAAVASAVALAAGGSTVPDVALAGGVAALAAAWLLLRSPRPLAAAALAGMFAGAWTAALEVQGLHRMLAVVVALALPLASALLAARRRQFLTPVMREEALMFVGLLGAVAALAPGVTDGWHAAVNLNLTSGAAAAGATSAQSPMLPAWTMGVVGTAVSVGALYTIWSRR